MTTRPFLNQASFPAENEEVALQCLADLRRGFGRLSAERLIDLPVMCNARASQLPLTPDYKLLPNLARDYRGPHRDTILFFLQLFDQRSPAVDLSDQTVRDAVQAFEVEGIGGDHSEDDLMPIVLCSLESGVLLSLASDPKWRSTEMHFTAMLAAGDALVPMACSNVFDDNSAITVGASLRETARELTIDNWDLHTHGAGRSPQFHEWLAETEREKGLTTIVMRMVKAAREAKYRPDGTLIKKLQVEEKDNIYEVRAWYNGSNNVRLLFVRQDDGSAHYCFGGRKNSPNWYDRALAHTKSVIDGL